MQFTALTAGQEVELGGLKFTAGANGATAAEVAAAFANLADGATTGPGTAKGTYSGTLTGYSTGAASNTDQVVFTSTAVGNVTDLAAPQTSTVGAITVTDGGAGVTFAVTVSGTNLVITPSTGISVVASGTDFVSGVTYPRGTVNTAKIESVVDVSPMRFRWRDIVAQLGWSLHSPSTSPRPDFRPPLHDAEHLLAVAEYEQHLAVHLFKDLRRLVKELQQRCQRRLTRLRHERVRVGVFAGARERHDLLAAIETPRGRVGKHPAVHVGRVVAELPDAEPGAPEILGGGGAHRR